MGLLLLLALFDIQDTMSKPSMLYSLNVSLADSSMSEFGETRDRLQETSVSSTQNPMVVNGREFVTEREPAR